MEEGQGMVYLVIVFMIDSCCKSDLVWIIVCCTCRYKFVSASALAVAEGHWLKEYGISPYAGQCSLRALNCNYLSILIALPHAN